MVALPRNNEPKTIALADVLTREQMERCFEICALNLMADTSPHKKLVEFLEPLMPHINSHLPAESQLDTAYFAYVVEHVFNVSVGRR